MIRFEKDDDVILRFDKLCHLQESLTELTDDAIRPIHSFLDGGNGTGTVCVSVPGRYFEQSKKAKDCLALMFEVSDNFFMAYSDEHIRITFCVKEG